MHTMQLKHSLWSPCHKCIRFIWRCGHWGRANRCPLGQAGPPTGETDCYLPLFLLQLHDFLTKKRCSLNNASALSPPLARSAGTGRDIRGFTGVPQIRLLMRPKDWVRWSRLCLEEFESSLQWSALFTPCDCSSRVIYELHCSAWLWCWANVVSSEYLTVFSLQIYELTSVRVAIDHLTFDVDAFRQTGVLIALLFHP